MVGKYDIVVENAYLKYEFTIRRNITIIRGDSATGKTTLTEMIRSYFEDDDSGIKVKSEKELVVVSGKNWKQQIEGCSDSIIFIDEQNRFVKSDEFVSTIKGTDNYYVIITREKLSNLPYSVTEIYGIRNRGKYAGLVGTYTQNEFYRIYGEHPTLKFSPDVIITEDSNSGFDFWRAFFSDRECISAEGKSNIIDAVKNYRNSDNSFLAIVDGAAFGPEMEDIIQYIKYNNPKLEVYAPESFEYVILDSGIIGESTELKNKLTHTEDYADSVKYMSWEQFYTKLLASMTIGTEKAYTKSKLNQYYLSEKQLMMVRKNIPEQIG